VAVDKICEEVISPRFFTDGLDPVRSAAHTPVQRQPETAAPPDPSIRFHPYSRNPPVGPPGQGRGDSGRTEWLQHNASNKKHLEEKQIISSEHRIRAVVKDPAIIMTQLGGMWGTWRNLAKANTEAMDTYKPGDVVDDKRMYALLCDLN
jgi:hypothetical protein